jgi:hypothetical protein
VGGLERSVRIAVRRDAQCCVKAGKTVYGSSVRYLNIQGVDSPYSIYYLK